MLANLLIQTLVGANSELDRLGRRPGRGLEEMRPWLSVLSGAWLLPAMLSVSGTWRVPYLGLVALLPWGAAYTIRRDRASLFWLLLASLALLSLFMGSFVMLR